MKYDVYGMGNALLDIEYEVQPQQLQDLGIDKGVMTLIDADRQADLMQRLSELPHKRSSGGSAANSIVAIAQFGGSCFYSCKVASDDFGSSYMADLQACGVATNPGERETGVTGQCLVFVTPDADRTMNTFLGISGQFSAAELVPDAIGEAQYLFIEGYLVTADDSRAAAIKAREHAQTTDTKVAMSLADLNMAKFFKPGLLDIIGPGIDFIFANESEALEMAGTQTLDDAIAYLKTLSRGFAITQGPRGSLIFDGDTLHEIAPNPVKAVDTVGAGDMYAGALLYGLTHGKSYPEAGKLASLASSKLVTNLGPRMPAATVRGLLQTA